MASLKDKIISLKDKLLANKLYFYCLLAILFVFLVVIIILIARPEKPEIPVVPREGWARNLLSYWAFEERRGQKIFDAKSGFHHGRLGFDRPMDGAEPERYKRGKIGRALKFDGQDDFAIVQDHPGLRISEEITLAGWFWTLGSANPSPEPIWLAGFQYRRQITIDNRESREDFEDFQLLLVLDTASLIARGKMQPGCQDLRITDYDETTELFYWLQSGCNTEKTRVWVRVPNLSAGLMETLYFYYGNPQAVSQSNFDETMEVPPIQWWRYPKERQPRREKRINALAVDIHDNIIAVGSDAYIRNMEWRYETIGPRGEHRRDDLENFSLGDDEINDAIFDLDNRLVKVGYDFLPGNSQWRAEKKPGFTFTSNFSPGADEIKAVAVDLENNVLLAGYDSVPGNPQWRLMKLDIYGKEVWSYTIDFSKHADIISDVKVDSRNNIFIVGYDKALGDDRWQIKKLSPDRTLLFSYALNVSRGSDVPNAIAIDSEDNIIIVGYDFFHGNAQWRMVKLNERGTKLWDWSFNPSPGFDALKSVAIDSEDNIIIAGYDSLDDDFAWQVLKFNPQGRKIWEWRHNPSEEFDELKDMVIDSEGNIILAGYDFSLMENPRWCVMKISEKKPVFPQPGISVKGETVVRPLPGNIIIAKHGSYRISATEDQIFGFINEIPISAPLKNEQNENWHHFALTYDGDKQNLYLNGALVNSRALVGEIETNFNNLFIGYNFNGLIDELKIYKHALSPEEIRFLFNRR